MVVEFSEAVDSGVDTGQVVGQVLAFPELASPGSVGPLDPSVELRGPRRQDAEDDLPPSPCMPSRTPP